MTILLQHVTTPPIDPELTPTLFSERVGDLNPENLAAYKPGQYQPSKKDFRPGFKEKVRFKSDRCLINNTVINV